MLKKLGIAALSLCLVGCAAGNAGGNNEKLPEYSKLTSAEIEKMLKESASNFSIFTLTTSEYYKEGAILESESSGTSIYPYVSETVAGSKYIDITPGNLNSHMKEYKYIGNESIYTYSDNWDEVKENPSWGIPGFTVNAVDKNFDRLYIHGLFAEGQEDVVEIEDYRVEEADFDSESDELTKEEIQSNLEYNMANDLIVYLYNVAGTTLWEHPELFDFTVSDLEDGKIEVLITVKDLNALNKVYQTDQYNGGKDRKELEDGFKLKRYEYENLEISVILNSENAVESYTKKQKQIVETKDESQTSESVETYTLSKMDKAPISVEKLNELFKGLESGNIKVGDTFAVRE